MPNKPTTKNTRRQFLKATATGAVAGMPLTVFGNNTVPPIISLLLDDNENLIDSAAVLEGEGTGNIVDFPDNTVTLNQGRNTVEAFFAKFETGFSSRSGEEDHGFSNLSAQLPEAVEQEVTLTIRAVSPSNPTISVNTPTQTVMSDASGLAVFDKVVFLEHFDEGDGFLNHTFELRYSSAGFDDSVITVLLDLEGAFLENGSVVIESAPAPFQTRTFFFIFGTSNTVGDFYERFRPDLQNANGGPEVGISSLGVQLNPAPVTPINVSVKVEVIEGNQISLDPNTANQTILTSERRPNFQKVAFIPDNFGPAGTANPITTNHRFRLTWTADGYTPVSYEFVLDLESPVSPS